MKQSWKFLLAWMAATGLLFGLAACSRAPSDDSIGQAIKASYYSDPQLRNERVDIAVQNGEVTLTGDVSSDAARLQAYKLAADTPGVKKVVDSMQVNPAVSAQAAPAAQPQIPEPQSPLPAKGPSSTASRTRPPAEHQAPAAAETGPQAPAPPSSMAVSSAPASAPAPQSPPSPAPPPAPRRVTISSGTVVKIQMIDSVNSESSAVGEKFLASLVEAITVDDEPIVPKGANVYVRLVEAKSAGKLTGQSELRLELDRIEFQGKSYPLKSGIYQQVGASRGKDTAKKAAIGAVIGTAIGAIAGGGKGAAIGAGVGAGGGTAVQVLTKGKEVRVPSETKLDFQLEQPLEVTIQPGHGQRSVR